MITLKVLVTISDIFLGSMFIGRFKSDNPKAKKFSLALGILLLSSVYYMWAN